MNWLKLLPYVIGLTVIIAISAWIYDAGYTSAQQKYETEKVAAIQRAIKQAEEQRKIDLAIAEESQKVEIQTRTVYKNVYKEADNVKSSCPDIGTDFISVYRNAIEAASKTASTQ